MKTNWIGTVIDGADLRDSFRANAGDGTHLKHEAMTPMIPADNFDNALHATPTQGVDPDSPGPGMDVDDSRGPTAQHPSDKAGCTRYRAGIRRASRTGVAPRNPVRQSCSENQTIGLPTVVLTA